MAGWWSRTGSRSRWRSCASCCAKFSQVGEPVAIQFASPRPFSAAAVVRTAHGSVFVKRHARNIRDREGLLEEHRFLAHLRESRRIVCRACLPMLPVKRRWKSGDGPMRSTNWRPARTFTARHLVDAVFLRGACGGGGRGPGELHVAAEGFDAPLRKVRPLVASFTIFAAGNPDAAMEHYLAARPALADHAGVHRCANRRLNCWRPSMRGCAAAAGLAAALDAQRSARFQSAVERARRRRAGHGGYRFRAGRPDERGSRSGARHRAQHCGVAGTGASIPSSPDAVPVHLDHLEALLSGYESVRPLSARRSRGAGADDSALPCGVRSV